LTVNGSGPSTPWLTERTLDSDLDETIVPEPPSSLKAKAYDKEIIISWTPPKDNTILVRGYTIGWGKGIPDELTKLVDDKQRQFTISNLSKILIFIHVFFYFAIKSLPPSNIVFQVKPLLKFGLVIWLNNVGLQVNWKDILFHAYLTFEKLYF